ncbi:MAG: HAMP domain-containing histidine kinase [Lachnospiraceae bacterium]|nr:HAMP domain-containing histidine kinase [Lachnospiraceae bacterium]
MNKFLHFLQHVVFICLALLVVNLVVFNFTPYRTAKNDSKYHYISQNDIGNTFKDSETFNKMFGISVSDVIDYCGVLRRMEDAKNKKGSQNLLSSSSSDDEKIANVSRYNDLFNPQRSNIRFYAVEKSGTVVYTQTNLGSASLSADELKKKLLDECDRYIYLDAAGKIFETNTLIEEDTVYSIFRESPSDYPSDTVLMVGLKRAISAPDEYKEAMTAFNAYTVGFYFKAAGLVVCAVIYVFLLVVLTVREGYIRGEDGKRLVKVYPTDRIPFEIRLVLLYPLILVFGLFFETGLGRRAGRLLYGLYVTNILYALIIVAILALTLSFIIAFFYYGFVRRVKAGIWWNTSITCFIVRKIAKLVDEVRGNLPVFIRTWLPYAAFVLYNVVFAYLIYNRRSLRYKLVFSIPLIAVDVIVGYLIYRSLKERSKITDVIDKICEGDISAKADEENVHGENIGFARAVNSIGKSVNDAVNKSMKDEKMKTDLITNVSHDLKTPLTSIINYVDLLKKENINNDTAVGYINILDEKSQRLKQLTDDLVEASKISSGNIVLQYERLNVKALIDQMNAEFYDKFEEKQLSVVTNSPEKDVYISADSRSMFRVLENLMTNINKYALPGTRVYTDITSVNKKVDICLKNISANPLNISSSELMERFVRGDESRTTEGSGLGLSIAKNLTEAMGGTFDIHLDGDLFKVTVSFKEA